MNAMMMSPDNALAISAGRKIQTRRTSKVKKFNHNPDGYVLEDLIEDPPHLFGETGTYAYFHRKSKPHIQHIIKAPYEIDQVVFIRENWRLDDLLPYRQDGDNISVRVRYAGERNQPQNEIWINRKRYKQLDVMKSVGWKPSLFMPVEVARLFVLITEITVQRLHDITDDDILAEGFSRHGENSVRYTQIGGKKYFKSALEGWIWLWDSINGEGDYDKNPWVWRIGFKKAEKPPL